nr:ovalbumin-related protein X-like [Helicoverpa armigera]
MARHGIIFLFLTALIPLISGQCDLKTATPFFKRAVYEFTLDLVGRINQETESHFVSSALSPWTLLSAMSLGASDTSLQEIKEVIKLHPHKCFNNLYFQLVNQVTMKPSNPTASMLERSSTIFLDDTLYVKQSFFDAIAKVGICDAAIVSFADATVTAAVINEHVRSVTNEAIDEIVTSGDLVNILIVMIDALYFKGAWKIPFPYEDTEYSAFYNDLGQQIGDANLMYVSGAFNMTSVPQISAKVLELPYGDESRYSMLIFLPDKEVSVTTMIEKMKYITVSSVFILFEQHRPRTVAVQIPRFKISSDLNNLKELLIDMGLRTLFDPTQASFPGISDYQMSLSNFIQKADIEVTEDGTVAAAATAALFESRMLPEQFVANKPFMFMIVDRILHVPIFTGAYSKPSDF